MRINASISSRPGFYLGCPGLIALALAMPLSTMAHFQELIPTTEMVQAADQRDLTLEMRFTHPMAQGPIMPMGKPVAFGVLGPEGRVDLMDQLHAMPADGQPAYRASYRIDTPGDYLFYLEPAAYWEPAEGKLIKHYTKTVVDAFSGGGGWAQEVGFPVEILPLTRPYGLWVGNVLQGVVQRQGQPAPFAEVEVEWRNDGTVTPPGDAFVTQVIKADANGTFTYAMPRAGWWGFAALLTADEPQPNPDGQPVPVEEGALLWVRVREMSAED